MSPVMKAAARTTQIMHPARLCTQLDFGRKLACSAASTSGSAGAGSAGADGSGGDGSSAALGCSIFGDAAFWDAAFCGDACTSSSFCCSCFCSSSSVCSREQRLYGRSTTSSPRTHTLQCSESENCERPEMTGAHLGCELLESCLDIHQLSVVLARLRRPVDGAIGRTRVGSTVEQNSMNTPHTETRKQERIFEQGAESTQRRTCWAKPGGLLRGCDKWSPACCSRERARRLARVAGAAARASQQQCRFSELGSRYGRREDRAASLQSRVRVVSANRSESDKQCCGQRLRGQLRGDPDNSSAELTRRAVLGREAGKSEGPSNELERV